MTDRSHVVYPCGMAGLPSHEVFDNFARLGELAMQRNSSSTNGSGAAKRNGASGCCCHCQQIMAPILSRGYL